MGPQIIDTLVPFAFFALMFGIVYIRSRENMAMIERGMNPRDLRPRHFVGLRLGLLFSGAGLGLLTAYLMDNYTIKAATAAGKYTAPAMYFSLVALGGGIGLVLSYFIEKKYWEKHSDKQ